MAPAMDGPTVTNTAAATHRSRSGFTLVELTTVVILLALIAGIATVVFRDPYRKARHQATIDRLEFIDPHVRRVAKKRPGELVFDLSKGTATWQERDTGPVSESVTLASGLLIDEIWTLAGGTQSSGEVTVSFHPNGTSGTYAVRTSVNDIAVRWLLFVGMTGQQMEIGDDNEAQAVLESLVTSGPDAG